MTQIAAALAALKFGYEVDGKTMGDDGMIEHLEVLSTSYDELILAMAKAAVLDSMMKISDEENVSLLNVHIGREVGTIIRTELEQAAARPAQAAPRV